MALNVNTSIVDWLKANNRNSSFQSRANLARQYGIGNYRGTAKQNVQMLNYLKAGQQPKAPTPTKAPPKPAKPVISSAEQAFYNQYTNAIRTGSNDLNKLSQYNSILSKYGLKAGALDENTLRNLSLKALNGDAAAKNYLNAMKFQAMSGSGLWKGFDTKNLENGTYSNLRNAYMKDNPYANYTKDYDMRHYDSYNKMILENAPMTEQQRKWYADMVKKWDIDNYEDPFVQQRLQLEKDKQAALSAQDVALNQGLGAQDAVNFQMFQQLQEQMANRGMSGSGIAADAYMRAQMGMNQNYQEAFADAAITKSDINTQFNDAISGSKVNQQGYKDQLSQWEKENQLEQSKMDIELQKLQTDQDKYLTNSTGYVYFGGKMLMNGGKPITSLEFQKLSEQQRHNLATEALTGQKNAWDYQLGLEQNAIGRDSNAIRREQIAADLQTTMAKLKLDYAKLDYNYAKLESNNKIQQDKIKIAADNAQTSAIKSQISALGKQLDNVTKQITAYQKQGKKPPKSLVDQYNSLQNQISSLVGGSGF